jgi:xanthine dehydrogenase YagR molybdenum-binding subunit
VDGREKVSGAAKFSADVSLSNLAHACAVTSTIPRGRVAGFALPTADEIPGLLAIYSYHDFKDTIRPVKHLMAGGYVNSSALPLGSAEIFYAGQIVALVVAESLEAAEEAADRVVVQAKTVRRRNRSPIFGKATRTQSGGMRGKRLGTRQ